MVKLILGMEKMHTSNVYTRSKCYMRYNGLVIIYGNSNAQGSKLYVKKYE